MLPNLHIPASNYLVGGLSIRSRRTGGSVYVSSDTSAIDESRFASHDGVLHDCETSSFVTGTHARYESLAVLSPALKSKTWLTHYSGTEPLPDARKDGFRGFVEQGQVIRI